VKQPFWGSRTFRRRNRIDGLKSIRLPIHTTRRAAIPLFLMEAPANRPRLAKHVTKFHQHAVSLAPKLELTDSLPSNDVRDAQFVMGAEQVLNLCRSDCNRANRAGVWSSNCLEWILWPGSTQAGWASNASASSGSSMVTVQALHLSLLGYSVPVLHCDSDSITIPSM
jgi:hypothetical protein